MWKYLAVTLLLVSTSCGSESYENYAHKMEKKYDLPKGLLVSICRTESNWRNVRGQLDEIGVCQLRVSTVSSVFPELIQESRQRFVGPRSDKNIIRKLQWNLNRQGLYTGPIDGLFSEHLRIGIKSFQRQQHLAEDGIVGRITWDRLFSTNGREPYPYRSLEEQLWDPLNNIEISASYIRWLSERVGRDRAILAASYNGGPNHPIVKYMIKVTR